MKYANTVLGLASVAQAHYTFSDFILNGQAQGGPFEYIREHDNGYWPTKFAGQEVTEDDGTMGVNIDAPTFACQPGAESGANTGVVDIMPGDSVGFKQAFGGTGIEHPGPVQVYMSKAPGSVKEYDGSGEWFKIHQKLLCSPPGGGAILTDAWCQWGRDTIDFTIPDGIEPGEYLVRAEHIGLHGAHDHGAEFYFACGQVNLGGSGTGSAGVSTNTTTSTTESASSAVPYAAPPASSSATPTDYEASSTSVAAAPTDYAAPPTDYAGTASTETSDSCNGGWSGAGTWKSKRQSFETVSFPGGYTDTDPEVNFNLWDDTISEYPEAPGPAVIPGGETEGSTTGATSSKHKRSLRQLMHPRNFAGRV